MSQPPLFQGGKLHLFHRLRKMTEGVASDISILIGIGKGPDADAVEDNQDDPFQITVRHNLCSSALVLIYRPIVLAEIFREEMGSVIFRNKVEVIDVGWIERCVKRLLPGIGNRTGGKADKAVGVVWRGGAQIFF